MTTQRSLGLIALLALLLPCAALGADLTFDFGAYADYDSNVFRRETNEEDDVLFRLIPGVKLHEDRGQDLNYSLQYRVPMEFAVENGNRLNDVDQWVDADALYHVNDRLDLFIDDQFRYLRSTLRTDQTLDSTGVPIISTERDRVTINELRGGGRYRFTPRLSGTLQSSYRIFDSTRPDRADNFSVDVTASGDYRLTSKQELGAGLTYLRQEFDQTIDLVGSTSDSVNAFARWRYQLGETLGIEVQAGPSFISVNQDDPLPVTAFVVPFIGDATDPNNVFVFLFPSTCVDLGVATVFANCSLDPTPRPRSTIEGYGTTPITSVGALGDTRTTSVDIFANARITKRWTPNFVTSARYSRSQGVASGLGGTVIRDTVTLAADWDFRDRWNFLLRGDWVGRNSVTEANQIVRIVENGASLTPALPGVVAFEGSQFSAPLQTNTINTNRFGVTGRLTHRVFRNTDAILQFTYNEQNSDQNTLGRGSDFQGYIATLGVRHVFEPIKLW